MAQIEFPDIPSFTITDRHHLTWRGPHGGRINVLASLQGRADAEQIARAARLAHVEGERGLATTWRLPASPSPLRSVEGRSVAVR